MMQSYDQKWIFKNYKIVKKFFIFKGVLDEDLNPNGFILGKGDYNSKAIISSYFDDKTSQVILKRVSLDEFIDWYRNSLLNDIL